MKLTLDHTQRLNLHALLGAQRADVGSIRAIWALLDKLALDAEEEKAIKLGREVLNGQTRTVWDAALAIPLKVCDFGETEVARIKTALQTWDSYAAGADRLWLQPLLEAIFPAERDPHS